MSHISVLFRETLEALNIKPGGVYVDGTFGAGGHSRGILEQGGTVIALDRDQSTLEFATKSQENWPTSLKFHQSNFSEIGTLLPALGYPQVDGVLLDLGVSSMQFDQSERGFSFRMSAPLDMRMDMSQTLTAADLVNGLSEDELAEIFWEFGDEKHGRRFARAIVGGRPLTTTVELAELIAKATPGKRFGDSRGKKRIHPATKVFQALRIAVNSELDALQLGLDGAIEILRPGGRIAIISFHSLEDRIVKETFRMRSDPWYKVPTHVMEPEAGRVQLKRITKKPIAPSDAEIAQNPRCRSSKLRVAEKI
ncbi:MAG: 16S rRNA (cytosine1402-N4)-methyltransferase [Cellvibrionaceae bacterium]|jgi:16S rRNA (cytosine1402-N4)-methyltransferase